MKTLTTAPPPAVELVGEDCALRSSVEAPQARLLVFSDDWGRHPSSCQHLVRRMLPRVNVHWVNTIGMRRPRLDRATFSRGMEKLRGWTASARHERDTTKATNPAVLSPWMWPGFGRRWERRVNRQLLERSLRRAVPLEECVALTTVPIVADLVGRLPVKSWVYYRVDDFAAWPGHDAKSVAAMERQLIASVDRIVAAGENLSGIVTEMGRTAEILTHGVDLELWKDASANTSMELSPYERPVILFWGLIDRRLDVAWLESLDRSLDRGSIVLVGPEQDPPPELERLRRVFRPGAVPMERLPSLAAAADVLIVPYTDSPVTRAMQPLKLKEYLATAKPVVARNLPAVESWRSCLDVADNAPHFVELVLKRCATTLAQEQALARRSLERETWTAKAAQLEKILFAAE